MLGHTLSTTQAAHGACDSNWLSHICRRVPTVLSHVQLFVLSHIMKIEVKKPFWVVVYNFASYTLAVIWPMHIILFHLVGTLIFWSCFLKIQINVAVPPAHHLHSLLGFH